MKIHFNLATTVVLGVFCIGCAGDPFIDASIAKLDAKPVQIAERFKLPEVPPLPISPQPADMLVGAWETGIQHPVHRNVGKDGQIHDLDKLGRYFQDVWQAYGFNEDGTFLYLEKNRIGTFIVNTKITGAWLYDEGKLTLHETNYSNESIESLAFPGFASTTVIDRLTICRVDWYAHDEISIVREGDSDISEKQTNRHKTVAFDEYGVKTERVCETSGSKDGRETGVVSEEIHPPMHFWKKAK